MKKRIFVIIALLAGLFILVFLFTCIPKKINIKYPAVVLNQDNSKFIKNITIEMKGKLYKPLFLNSKYVGTCIIGGYSFTKNYQLIDVVFNRNIENGMGVLSYTTIKKNATPDLKMIGCFRISGNIDTLCINGVNSADIDKKGFAKRVIISAPARTQEEAILIAKKLKFTYH